MKAGWLKRCAKAWRLTSSTFSRTTGEATGAEICFRSGCLACHSLSVNFGIKLIKLPGEVGSATTPEAPGFVAHGEEKSCP